MSEPIAILYAEDDRIIRDQFSRLLIRAGYDVRAVRNGQEAVDDFSRRRSDVILLDVMMPVLSGHDACIAIRTVDQDVPIVFHTALDGEVHELSGLGVGADDYITKSASPEKFLARIAAAARRVHKASGAGFLFGFGRVDVGACVFSEGDKVSRLSFREIELLRVFVNSPGIVLSKDFLQTRVFGMDYEGDLRSFDKTVERLKSKLGSSAAFIRTIPRQGLEYTPPK